MTKLIQKKSEHGAGEKRETWTFQPADDVRRAVEFKYGDVRAVRGLLTELCNNAIRNFIPDAIKTILEQRHRAELARITGELEKLGNSNSKPASPLAGKFSALAEKALSRERPSRRRKP